MLNSYTRAIFYILAILHIIAGIVFLPMAVKIALLVIAAKTNSIPDFTTYYTAASIAWHAPTHLYQPTAFADIYATINPRWGQSPQSLPYIALPTIALLLRPLALLPYTTAFLCWSFVNLLLCGIFAWQIGKFADLLQLKDLKLFFQSCIIGLVTTFYIFLRGQFTLLPCISLMYFLLATEAKKNQQAAFWCAVLLQLKPQLFVPLLFSLAGCRQWRQLAFTALWSFAFLWAAMIGIDAHVWQDYVAFSLHLSGHNTSTANLHPNSMINLLGMLSAMPSTYLHSLSQPISLVIFICVCLFCFAWPLRKIHNSPSQDFILIFPLVLFSTPYLNLHDLLLLLPSGMAITARLLRKEQACWMVLPYILASYILGLSPLYEWQCRFIVIMHCALCIYLLRHVQESNIKASL